jgi:RNA polymerase sigma-70 factor (ECF subfamily)
VGQAGGVGRRRRILRPRASDKRAFDEEFDVLFPLALSVARRLVLDRTAAEDIAAETVARAFNHWRDMRDWQHAHAWVARVATNLSLDVLRRRPPPLSPATVIRIEDAALNRLALAAALARLPKRQREVVVLRYLADLPEAAVAVELGIAPATVKVHLRRAVGELRAIFDDPGANLAR